MNSVSSRLAAQVLGRFGVEVVELALEDGDDVAGDVLEDLRVLDRAPALGHRERSGLHEGVGLLARSARAGCSTYQMPTGIQLFRPAGCGRGQTVHNHDLNAAATAVACALSGADALPRDLLTAAAGHAADFLETLPEGRVEAEVLDADELRARLAMPLPDAPTDPRTVARRARRRGDAGHRAQPVAALLRLRDRRGAAGGARGRRRGRRLGPERRRLLGVARRVGGRGGRRRRGCSTCSGLPAGASFGLTTGCQQAHVTCLAAARNAVLARRRMGRRGRRAAGRAARCALLVSEERHVTDRPRGADPRLRHRRAGAGRRRRRRAACDAAALRAALAAGRRADDRVRPGGRRQHRRLRPARRDRRRPPTPPARGSTSTAPSACGRRRARAHRHLLDGVERRRLLGHRRPQVAQRPLRLRPGVRAPTRGRTAPRWSSAPPTCAARARASATARDWVPEFSRRGARLRGLRRAALARARRASPSWSSAAARCARRFADGARRATGVEVLNDVVLNQVLVRFGDDDATHRRGGRRRAGARAPAGWARRRGAAGAPCASRCATGRRRSATSIARARRSSPRSAPRPRRPGDRVARWTRATC